MHAVSRKGMPSIAAARPPAEQDLFWVIALYYPVLEIVPSVIVILTYKQGPELPAPSPPLPRGWTPAAGGDALHSVGSVGKQAIRQALLAPGSDDGRSPAGPASRRRAAPAAVWGARADEPPLARSTGRHSPDEAATWHDSSLLGSSM